MTAEEVARRLDLPVRTVIRWAQQGRIPAIRESDAVVFDERELGSWAREHRLVLDASRQRPAAADGSGPVSLGAAFRRGGVHREVPAPSVTDALAEAARRAPVPDDAWEELTERLLQREELSSTGIGGGVAIPHPRTPLTGVVDRASITTCFLDRDLEFSAIDGEPVHTLLVILSTHTKEHLRLLARLAFRLRDPAFRELLRRRAPDEELFAALVEADPAEPDAADG